MRRMTIGFAICSLLGCGPGGETSESPAPVQLSIPVNTPSAPAPSSLRAILGTPGESLSPDRLADIGAFLTRWGQAPYAEVPDNDTGMSTYDAFHEWLLASPDVNVVTCNMLAVLAERDGEGGNPELAFEHGSLVGMAAYLIEHPGADAYTLEVQVAGSESALRWYNASLSHGQRPNTFAESVVQRMEFDDGLANWTEEHQVRCLRPENVPEP